MKKGIVIGIIILFIGLAVAPSINANVNRTPVKNKLVETAVRIYNSRGITPYKLKLTEKESDEIDRIFDNLKVSLDSAETGEQIDEIFDDAVESLYELGMFPKMTLEEAKQLVNGKNQNPNVKSRSGSLGTVEENFNCKIAGTADECYSYRLGRWFLGGLLLTLILAFQRIIDRSWNFPYFNGRIGMISFGSYFANYHKYYPSHGWVFTNGTNGVIKWDRACYGNIDYWEEVTEHPHGFTETWGYYSGVDEFNGVFIDPDPSWPYEPNNFLGNAEHVSLSYIPSWP